MITIERIKKVLRDRPSISNAAMARIFIEEDRLSPYDVEKIRQKIRKLKKGITPDDIKRYSILGSINTYTWTAPKNIESTIEKRDKLIIDSQTQSTTLQESILVIGDLHCPATHKEYLSFNINLAIKYNCTKIVFIGDIVDGHSISYHETNPNLDSPLKELEKAKEELSNWYKAFPNAVVLNGNHDLLYTRKLNTVGLPSIIMKPLSTILGVDNWKFENEHIIGNHYFTHGTKLNTNSIKNKALKIQKNVICGHLHSESYVKNITQDLWVSHIGCGVDFSHRFFDYARGTDREPIISSLVIVDNQPILIKM